MRVHPQPVLGHELCPWRQSSARVMANLSTAPSGLALARVRRAQWKDLPLLARRIGAMGKVHVPELAVDELAWVKIETNQAASITGHLFVELTEFRFALFQIGPIIVWPELRPF